MKPSVYDSLDYHALIRRIREIDRAGKDSTLARLVTADWLQERGEEERALYIRERCQPRLRWFVEHSSFRSLRESGVFLCLPSDVGNDAFDGGVTVGGFLDSVFCSLAWWLTHGPDLCRRHPVREVVITGDWVHLHARPTYPTYSRYVVWPSMFPMQPPPPEVVSSVLAEINYGRPRETEDEVRAEVSAAYLKWAEHEADTTPGG